MGYIVTSLLMKHVLLFEKAQDKIGKILNPLLFNLLKLAVHSKNKIVISTIEEFFFESGDSEDLLLLISAQLSLGYSTENSKKLFLKIIDKEYPKLVVVEKFLSITGKSYSDLIQLLIEHKCYGLILHIIQIHQNKTELLDEIIPVIFTHVHSTLDLTDIAIKCMEYSPKFNDRWIGTLGLKQLKKQLLLSYYFNFRAIICLIRHLSERDSQEFLLFEQELVEMVDYYVLLRYAKEFELSNKRLIFRQLLKNRKTINGEKNIVNFTQAFPEFQPLLSFL